MRLNLHDVVHCLLFYRAFQAMARKVAMVLGTSTPVCAVRRRMAPARIGKNSWALVVLPVDNILLVRTTFVP